MIPAGYMAKYVEQKPDWLNSDHIKNIYSLSSCISEDFDDYINYWKHNGFWLFDSPKIIISLATDKGIRIEKSKIFYYEVYERQYDQENKAWIKFSPESSFKTDILIPEEKYLNGYDIVSFFGQTNPGCSPLSCNSIAEKVTVTYIPQLECAKYYPEKRSFGTFKSSMMLS